MSDNCNMTGSYYTYLGVCYQGNPTIQLSSPDNPQPVYVYSTSSAPGSSGDAPVSLPEPAILPLLALGLVALYFGHRLKASRASSTLPS